MGDHKEILASVANLAALAEQARAVAAALAALDHAWEAADWTAPDFGDYSSSAEAFADGYPFKGDVGSLEDLVVATDGWADRLRDLADEAARAAGIAPQR